MRGVCYEEEGGQCLPKFSFWLDGFEGHAGRIHTDAWEVLRYIAMKFRDISIN